MKCKSNSKRKVQETAKSTVTVATVVLLRIKSLLGCDAVSMGDWFLTFQRSRYLHIQGSSSPHTDWTAGPRKMAAP